MTLGSLYIETQGYVLVLLENLHGMSCSGTCWLLGGAWFQCRYEAFDELLSINVPWSQEFSGVLRYIPYHFLFCLVWWAFFLFL